MVEFADMRLLPVMNGVRLASPGPPAPASRPVRTTMKLAVAEGDWVGSIEHVVHAALPGGRRAHPE